jgi:hypothetical protein
MTHYSTKNLHKLMHAELDNLLHRLISDVGADGEVGIVDLRITNTYTDDNEVTTVGSYQSELIEDNGGEWCVEESKSGIQTHFPLQIITPV